MDNERRAHLQDSTARAAELLHSCLCFLGQIHWVCTSLVLCHEILEEIEHLLQLFEIEIRLDRHLFLRAVRHKGVRQIQHRTRVAAIVDAGQCHSLGHGSDQRGVDIVIANLSGFVVVQL